MPSARSPEPSQQPASLATGWAVAAEPQQDLVQLDEAAETGATYEAGRTTPGTTFQAIIAAAAGWEQELPQLEPQEALVALAAMTEVAAGCEQDEPHAEAQDDLSTLVAATTSAPSEQVEPHADAQVFSTVLATLWTAPLSHEPQQEPQSALTAWVAKVGIMIE